MSSGLDKLKREIASIQANHSGSSTKRTYPAKIKTTATRLFRGQDASVSAFAKELGISNTALTEWLATTHKPRSISAMIPVKVENPVVGLNRKPPVASSPSRVTIIVIEGDESGAQSDQILRSLKIISQAS